MRKVKVGIVGLGRLGIKHARNIAYKIPNAELIAACSLFEEEVETAKKELGIKYGYTDYYEMINNKEIEAVAVISSSTEHCNHIEAALDKDLHVFTEKPLGISYEECKKVEKSVEKHKDKIFMIGFQRRYDPSYAYAKKKIEDGSIGKPVIVRATSIDPEYTVEGMIKYGPSGGGIFLDMTIHDIDMVRWLLQSEPVSVYAIGDCYFHKEFSLYGDVDNSLALMKFENGTMAELYSGRDGFHGYHVETEIICTKGTLRIGNVPQKNNVEILNTSGVVRECVQSFQERFDEAYFLEMQEFINCIVEERKPEIKVYDGTKNSQVAVAMTNAYKTGKIVNISLR